MSKALRVLVVDDDGAIPGTAEDATGEGFTVGEAVNGGEAIDKLHETKPSASLLDLMPVMDGWTFLEKCRPVAGDVPVLVIIVAASTFLECATRGKRCTQTVPAFFALRGVHHPSASQRT